LEALTIQDPEGWREDFDEDVAASMEAVGLLTNLTHLALAHYNIGGLQVSPPSLPGLRSLWWLAAGQPADAALPAGGWLANLLRLALPIRQLHNSRLALTSARQLQAQAIDADANLLPVVLRWASHKPNLQLVLLQVSNDAQLGRHFDAIL
jgi:hypothetical protein